MGISVQINGQDRTLETENGAPLQVLLEELQLRGDRIAVELNGAIVPRTSWAQNAVKDGDRLEIVHFVGGGAANCH